MIFFAVDADDEVMVTFRAEGLVAAARAAGMETTTVVALPSDEVELVVEAGRRVARASRMAGCVRRLVPGLIAQVGTHGGRDASEGAVHPIA